MDLDFVTEGVKVASLGQSLKVEGTFEMGEDRAFSIEFWFKGSIGNYNDIFYLTRDGEKRLEANSGAGQVRVKTNTGGYTSLNSNLFNPYTSTSAWKLFGASIGFLGDEDNEDVTFCVFTYQ